MSILLVKQGSPTERQNGDLNGRGMNHREVENCGVHEVNGTDTHLQRQTTQIGQMSKYTRGTRSHVMVETLL